MSRDRYNSRQIAKELLEKNIPTPGQRKAENREHAYNVLDSRHIWSGSAIRGILHDERYIGTYVMGKRESVDVGSKRTRPKDEKLWFKIPNHHPAIVDRDLFMQAQPKRRNVKRSGKINMYPLRGKVFCGCCCHAMKRVALKNPVFDCDYTKIEPKAECHGLRIVESELEKAIYEMICRQAEVMLNVKDFPSVDETDMRIAEQAEYEKQIK